MALRGRAMPEATSKTWQLCCADKSYRQFVLCIPPVSFTLCSSTNDFRLPYRDVLCLNLFEF